MSLPLADPRAPESVRRQRSGQTAEAILDAQHAVLETTSRGTLQKQRATVIVRGAERLFVGREGADYRGGLRVGAHCRYVCVECKSVTGTLGLRAGSVRGSQLAALETAHRLGGLAVLALVHREGPLRVTLYAVPWPAVADRVRAGKRLGVDDLRPYRVPPGTLYLEAPWLT